MKTYFVRIAGKETKVPPEVYWRMSMLPRAHHMVTPMVETVTVVPETVSNEGKYGGRSRGINSEVWSGS